MIVAPDGSDAQFAAACTRDELEVGVAREEISAGRLVFLRSMRSSSTALAEPILVGTIAKRKVAALVGLGPKDSDLDDLLATLPVILSAEPDAIMDLTTNENGNRLRDRLKLELKQPLGACITYDVLTSFKKPLSRNEIQDRVGSALSTGIDFALLHLGLNRELREGMARTSRIMPTTSRGGGLVARYMDVHGAENPFIEFFDEICTTFKEHGAVIDLGDIFRPGCLADAGDAEKVAELQLLAEIRSRAMDHGVQVLCETGGHMPLDAIRTLLEEYKSILGGAPLWLSGPVPLDIGVTVDDVVNAIGVSVAAQSGGDMFCSITHNEHYAMPTAPDTAAGIRATRVAIAAAEVAVGRPSAVERNKRMGEARRLNSWATQAEEALFPDLAHQAFLQHDLLTEGQPCTVCGSYCPLILVSKNHDVVFAAHESKRAENSRISDDETA